MLPVLEAVLEPDLAFYSSLKSRKCLRLSGVYLLPPVSSSRMKQWRMAVQLKLKIDRKSDPTRYAKQPIRMAGRIGCFISGLSIWKKLKDTKIEHAMMQPLPRNIMTQPIIPAEPNLPACLMIK